VRNVRSVLAGMKVEGGERGNGSAGGDVKVWGGMYFFLAGTTAVAGGDGMCRSRFPCLTTIAGQIIYYFIFGDLGACRQAPYRFKKSNGDGFVWGPPWQAH
jgi:hypothetical protein